MKLLLLLLIPLCFAAPPVADVMSNNSLIAQSMENMYNNSSSANDSFLVHFGPVNRNISVNASLDIAGMNLVIDNVSSPVQGLSSIARRGYQLGHLTSLPAPGYPDFICDLNWFQHITPDTAWRCDFDTDTCADYENSSNATYDMNATFTFRNVTANTTLTSNVVELPPEIMDAIGNSSGEELLNVSVYGNVYFRYVIDSRFFDLGCQDNFTNYTKNLTLEANRTFKVGGINKVFLLKSPPLSEQWYANDQFETIVLSEVPLYYAQASLNGNMTKNYTLRNFTVFTDDYGLEEIISNKTNSSGAYEWKNFTTPIPLEAGNNSFVYIYEFNYSYPGALGVNNLSLIVNDSFLRQANFSDNISSRFLSYNNSLSERGASKLLDPTRDSGTFNRDNLSQLQISLGLVAVILVLVFVNYWVVR